MSLATPSGCVSSVSDLERPIHSEIHLAEQHLSRS